MPKKEKVTLDVLARMMHNQFRDLGSNMATKTDIKRLEERFDGVDGRFDKVDERFDGVDNRLNTIEALLASNRIEKIGNLEKSVYQIKTLLKIS